MAGPITSPVNKPGFVPNEGGTWSGGKGTNAYWRQILAEYMASEWAHGNRDKVLEIISPTWISAKYGEPDPSDIAAGDNKWSERTLLAFSKWAADYQPGWSPYIDQVLPYVPPGPDEFIETPEQTADRVLNETQDKDRAEGARQFDITTGQSALDTWIQAELDKFATQGSIYGDQEQNRSENLRHAGDLSATLQAAMDARTKSALDQRADPGDYLRAEYESRAIAPPVGTTSPAYQNVDSLMEVIRRLIEYQANPAPGGPDIGARPETPRPAYGSYTNESQTTTTPPVAQTPAPATTGTNAAGQITYPDVPDYVNNRPPPQGNYGLGSAPGAQPILMPDGTVRSGNNPIPGFAEGVRGTRARSFISGDPKVAGKPNPEYIQVRNPGPKTRVDVTPLKKVAHRELVGRRMYADGTDSATITTYPDDAYQNSPRQKFLTGGSARDYGKLATGFAGAAFGMKVPESGRLNYGKFLNLANDPVALAMTAADYKSANRDLSSVVARAKARAPLGQSINTSMIRY